MTTPTGLPKQAPETPYELPKSRKWQPIHQRQKVVARYKSIRRFISLTKEGKSL